MSSNVAVGRSMNLKQEKCNNGKTKALLKVWNDSEQTEVLKLSVVFIERGRMICWGSRLSTGREVDFMMQNSWDTHTNNGTNEHEAKKNKKPPHQTPAVRRGQEKDHKVPVVTLPCTAPANRQPLSVICLEGFMTLRRTNPVSLKQSRWTSEIRTGGGAETGELMVIHGRMCLHFIFCTASARACGSGRVFVD